MDRIPTSPSQFKITQRQTEVMNAIIDSANMNTAAVDDGQGLTTTAVGSVRNPAPPYPYLPVPSRLEAGVICNIRYSGTVWSDVGGSGSGETPFGDGSDPVLPECFEQPSGADHMNVYFNVLPLDFATECFTPTEIFADQYKFVVLSGFYASRQGVYNEDEYIDISGKIPPVMVGDRVAFFRNADETITIVNRLPWSPPVEYGRIASGMNDEVSDVLYLQRVDENGTKVSGIRGGVLKIARSCFIGRKRLMPLMKEGLYDDYVFPFQRFAYNDVLGSSGTSGVTYPTEGEPVGIPWVSGGGILQGVIFPFNDTSVWYIKLNDTFSGLHSTISGDVSKCDGTSLGKDGMIRNAVIHLRCDATPMPVYLTSGAVVRFSFYDGPKECGADGVVEGEVQDWSENSGWISGWMSGVGYSGDPWIEVDNVARTIHHIGPLSGTVHRDTYLLDLTGKVLSIRGPGLICDDRGHIDINDLQNAKWVVSGEIDLSSLSSSSSSYTAGNEWIYIDSVARTISHSGPQEAATGDHSDLAITYDSGTRKLTVLAPWYRIDTMGHINGYSPNEVSGEVILPSLEGAPGASGYSGWSGYSGQDGDTGTPYTAGNDWIFIDPVLRTISHSGPQDPATGDHSDLSLTYDPATGKLIVLAPWYRIDTMGHVNGYSPNEVSGEVILSGYKGQDGESGYSGYSGYSGQDGESGCSGYSGYSGQDGLSGFSGEGGVSGYSGQDGLSGYSGFSWIDFMTASYSGQSGVPYWNGTTITLVPTTPSCSGA